MSRLFDIDPLSGAVEMFDFDALTGMSCITRTENVDAVLDANTESFNDGSQQWRGADNDFWHVGRIPLTQLQAWLDDFNKGRADADKLYSFLEENEEWERFMYRRWNSSDFRKLKTAPVNF